MADEHYTEDEIIHGVPGAPAPRGVLRGADLVETIPLHFAEPSAIAFTFDAGEPVAGDPITPTSKYAVIREDGALVVPSRGEWPHEAEPLSPDDRLELARVALHGQPCAPTGEMLAFLENPGQYMDGCGWFDADGERILAATAAFVRALLQP